MSGVTPPENPGDSLQHGKLRSKWRWACFFLCLSTIAIAQPPPAQTTPAQTTPAQPNPNEPVLRPRPSPAPGDIDGHIQLDVVVNGKQGSPVSGLDVKDFTILDNKKPQSVVSFQAVDGAARTPASQVEVILLLDLVNATFEQSSVTQQQMVKFLQQNDGHLPYATSIAIFSDQGVRIQPTGSTDGNRLAAQLNATVRLVGPPPVLAGEVKRFQSSLFTLLSIAENKTKTPSRKVLIWSGPGWPTLVGSNYLSSIEDRKRFFDAIVEVSTRLRDAHIALYSISSMNSEKGGAFNIGPAAPLMPSAEAPQQTRVRPAMNDSTDGSNYKDFVKGVKSAQQAGSGELALQVLAVQSGGRVLDPGNDLAAQMAKCVEDLSNFYRISFAPARAGHSDEYHDLKVEITKPGFTARTNTGFYNQP
jgi:VWFA-related protein